MFLALLLCTPAHAQDFVESSGPLEDAAFYRLVACAAPQDQPCAKPFYKWEKTELTIGIVARGDAFLGGKQKRADAALVRALQHLGEVPMALILRQSTQAPDITIHLLDIPRSETISMGAAHVLDGLTMANAITALDVTGSTINAAAIALSSTLSIGQYESVMLEEITQALGLITDIRNPYYNTRSILSQDADNSLKTLGIQDRMALILHYPPD